MENFMAFSSKSKTSSFNQENLIKALGVTTIVGVTLITLNPVASTALYNGVCWGAKIAMTDAGVNAATYIVNALIPSAMMIAAGRILGTKDKSKAESMSANATTGLYSYSVSTAGFTLSNALLSYLPINPGFRTCLNAVSAYFAAQYFNPSKKTKEETGVNTASSLGFLTTFGFTIAGSSNLPKNHALIQTMSSISALAVVAAVLSSMFIPLQYISKASTTSLVFRSEEHHDKKIENALSKSFNDYVKGAVMGFGAGKFSNNLINSPAACIAR
jgi:hypothetical protein